MHSPGDVGSSILHFLKVEVIELEQVFLYIGIVVFVSVRDCNVVIYLALE